MSELTTIFRRCPSCGKRFEIHITGKKLMEEKFVNDKVETPLISPTFVATRSGVIPNISNLAPMKEGVTTIDEKEFQYAYECKHCGHKWFEIVEKDDESTSWDQPPKL